MYKLITYCPGIMDKNEAHSMLVQLTAIKITTLECLLLKVIIGFNITYVQILYNKCTEN